MRRTVPGPGRNAIAAHASIELENDRRIECDTGPDWKAASVPAGEWFASAFDDSSWSAVTVLAPYLAQPSRYADTTIGPGRYLRKGFEIQKPVARARLYATALGVYDASINGHAVTSASVLDRPPR